MRRVEQHAHAEAHAEAEAPGACLNCGAALEGRFCGFCGQRALRLDVSLRELLHEGLHELLHVDGRILGSLRLLFTRPGRLTAEMLAGRRQRYVSPVRLYLVCSVLFFVTLAWVVPGPRHSAETHGKDRGATATAPVTREVSATSKGLHTGGDAAAYMHNVWGRAPKAAFLLVPVFALLTMSLIRRRVRFFVPHLYFALHVHSFLFLALSLFLLVGRASTYWITVAATLVLPPVYLVAAAREAFEIGWGEALWKSLLVLAVYGLVLATAVVTVLVIALF
jgi:hypothetical protein